MCSLAPIPIAFVPILRRSLRITRFLSGGHCKLGLETYVTTDLNISHSGIVNVP